jgi:multiple sugar transport system permease protein
LPLLTPTIFFNLVLSIISTFQTFTSAFVATDGGPLDATLFYVLYLFRQAFQYFNMGYASAMAWILFLIILVLTLVIVRSSGRWVYYEGERL